MNGSSISWDETSSENAYYPVAARVSASSYSCSYPSESIQSDNAASSSVTENFVFLSENINSSYSTALSHSQSEISELSDTESLNSVGPHPLRQRRSSLGSSTPTPPAVDIVDDIVEELGEGEIRVAEWVYANHPFMGDHVDFVNQRSESETGNIFFNTGKYIIHGSGHCLDSACQ